MSCVHNNGNKMIFGCTLKLSWNMLFSHVHRIEQRNSIQGLVLILSQSLRTRLSLCKLKLWIHVKLFVKSLHLHRQQLRVFCLQWQKMFLSGTLLEILSTLLVQHLIPFPENKITKPKTGARAHKKARCREQSEYLETKFGRQELRQLPFTPDSQPRVEEVIHSDKKFELLLFLNFFYFDGPVNNKYVPRNRQRRVLMLGRAQLYFFRRPPGAGFLSSTTADVWAREFKQGLTYCLGVACRLDVLEQLVSCRKLTLAHIAQQNTISISWCGTFCVRSLFLFALSLQRSEGWGNEESTVVQTKRGGRGG